MSEIKCVDAKEIFDEAEDFLEASELIRAKSSEYARRHGGKLSLMSKSIGLTFAFYVNHAYAFELYLKCLMVIEKGSFQTGHILPILFSKLSLENREKIINHFKSHSFKAPLHFVMKGVSNDDFEALIKKAHEPFLDYRYLFNGKQTKGYGLERAINSVKGIIFQYKPEYNVS